MSNINVTEGAGKVVSTETISGSEYQRIKIVGGETGSTSVLGIAPDGSIKACVLGVITVSVQGVVQVQQINNSSVSGTVGASILGTVPVTQSGTWIVQAVPKASFISGVTSIMTGTGLTSVLSAAGSTIKNYVTHIICTNGAATSTFVDIKDGGGNIIYSGFAAGSGGGFASYIYPPLVGSANKSIDAQPRTQASVIVAMTGYTDT